jgi:hypothetical protein
MQDSGKSTNLHADFFYCKYMKGCIILSRYIKKFFHDLYRIKEQTYVRTQFIKKIHRSHPVYPG